MSGLSGTFLDMCSRLRSSVGFRLRMILGHDDPLLAEQGALFSNLVLQPRQAVRERLGVRGPPET